MKNKIAMFLKRKDVQFMLVLMFILCVPTIAHAYPPGTHPAPDRGSEGFWTWFWNAMWG